MRFDYICKHAIYDSTWKARSWSSIKKFLIELYRYFYSKGIPSLFEVAIHDSHNLELDMMESLLPGQVNCSSDWSHWRVNWAWPVLASCGVWACRLERGWVHPLIALFEFHPCFQNQKRRLDTGNYWAFANPKFNPLQLRLANNRVLHRVMPACDN